MTTNESATCKLLHTSAPNFGNSTSNSLVVYTDASSTISAAGYWESAGNWFRYGWDEALKQANPGIVWMELFAIVIAVTLWGPQWSNQHVIFKTDSKSSVDAWCHARFGEHEGSMAMLMVCILLVARHYRFSVDVSYIPSNKNPVDTLSRDNLDEFFAKNPTADSEPPFRSFSDVEKEFLNSVRKLCKLPIRG